MSSRSDIIKNENMAFRIKRKGTLFPINNLIPKQSTSFQHLIISKDSVMPCLGMYIIKYKKYFQFHLRTIVNDNGKKKTFQ